MKLSLHNLSLVTIHDSLLVLTCTHLLENEVETFGVSNHETNSFNNSQNLLLPTPEILSQTLHLMCQLNGANVEKQCYDKAHLSQSARMGKWEILVRPVVVSMRLYAV